MVFSKSFGYAVRSVLYLVMIHDEQPRTQIQDVAAQLKVPRYFLGKIMKQLAKEGIIDSVKGPFGGFSSNDRTRSTSLIKIIELTEGTAQFKECVLRLRKCNAAKPCPMHSRIEKNRNELISMFKATTVEDLMKGNLKYLFPYI